MRIGVNLMRLRPGVTRSHEIYVRNLLRAMFEQDPRNTYYLITAPWNHQELDFGPGPYQRICLELTPSRPGMLRRLSARLRRSHWDVYRCAMELDLDLWLCPMTDLEPRYIDIPSVTLVADIQHEFYPQFFTLEELQQRQLTVKSSCQLATGVIAVSEFVRRNLIERYELEEKKVHRIYGAAPPECNPQLARESWPLVADRYGLEAGYLFYRADTWPHKNHELLLLALQRLSKRGLTPRLVLAGRQTIPLESLQDLAQQVGCRDQLLHLGDVEGRHLAGLYHGAACLVFPSLFEASGIPLLEAMASGCVVVGSDMSAVPEVIGDAGLMFDTRNPDSIADALERILRDASLRKRLVEKGFQQAARFSWQNSGAEALAAFDIVSRARAERVTAYVPPQEGVEGYYADGWAAPRMIIRRVELSRWRTLVLEGESTCHCYPLQIRVRGGGGVIDEFRLDSPCGFSRAIGLPAAAPNSSLSDIQVLSSAHFVPIKLGMNKDSRRLSFRVQNLALLAADGKSMVCQGR